MSRKKAGRPKHPGWPLVSVNVLIPVHDLKAAEAIAETYGLLRSEIIRTFVRAGIANAHRVSIVINDGVARVAV